MVGLGQRLKDKRMEKHLTQSQVGSLVSISKAMISNYELDLREPNLDTLVKLASLYNVSSDFLLGIDKNPSLSVSGLSPSQVSAIQSVIDSYHP